MNGLIGLTVCALAAVVNSKESNSALLTSKIIGGNVIPEGTYTFVVYITSLGRLKCGAALISIRSVLTTGNCVIGSDLSPDSLTIIIGTHRSTPSVAVQMYFACNILYHSYFLNNQPTNLADFAVITLRRDAELQRHGGYATLINLSYEEICAGRNALVLGWGFVDPTNIISNVLRSLEVEIISNTECSDTLQRYIDPSQICAVSRGNRENFAARDLGGPLVYRRSPTEPYKIIGIASLHFDDPELPGVYTRVFSFYNDINSMKTPNHPQGSIISDDSYSAWSESEASTNEKK